MNILVFLMDVGSAVTGNNAGVCRIRAANGVKVYPDVTKSLELDIGLIMSDCVFVKVRLIARCD